jgi:hypothetical protein
MDRRRFLTAMTAGSAAALGACTSSRANPAKSAPVAPTTGALPQGPKGPLGPLTIQVRVDKDVEAAGELMAQAKGYFSAQGLGPVTVAAAGPGVLAPETQVQTGRAQIAVSSLESAAAAIQRASPIVVVGAQYQKSPYGVTSLASKPINTPVAMLDKRIGVQPANNAVWLAFLRANRLEAAPITKVVVEFDPTALADGQVDGWLSSVTDEPIQLAQQQVKTTTFLLNDFGYPTVGNVFIASTESLRTARAKVKAAMTAEIMGWQEAIRAPDDAAQLATTSAGGVSLATEQQQARAQNQLIAAGDALQSGLFYVSPAAQAINVRTLGAGGIAVTVAQLFDMSVLDEVYQQHPDLKPVPAAGA